MRAIRPRESGLVDSIGSVALDFVKDDRAALEFHHHGPHQYQCTRLRWCTGLTLRGAGGGAFGARLKTIWLDDDACEVMATTGLTKKPKAMVATNSLDIVNPPH
jgi:hypothetical protein